MIDVVALAITVSCVASGVVVAVRAGRGRFRWARIAPTLAVLEAALVLQAAFDLGGLLGGHHPPELATHLAYLAVSIAVLPCVAVQTRGDDGRWSGVLVAVGLMVTAVIVIRLQTTWRAVDG